MFTGLWVDRGLLRLTWAVPEGLAVRRALFKGRKLGPRIAFREAKVPTSGVPTPPPKRGSASLESILENLWSAQLKRIPQTSAVYLWSVECQVMSGDPYIWGWASLRYVVLSYAFYGGERGPGSWVYGSCKEAQVKDAQTGAHFAAFCL